MNCVHSNLPRSHHVGIYGNIPISFSKYLKGCNQEHVILRRAGKKWLVKVNRKRLLEDGWGKFVEEHDLRLGDLLIFRHEGKMEFEVSVFGSNYFEREYEGEAGINQTITSQGLRANASLQPEGRKPNLDAKRVSSQRKRAIVPASTSANANSQFNFIIKPHSIDRALFYLPTAFARSNKLMRRCEMILRDEKQRSWSVQLNPVGPRFAITHGWRQFREANVVKVGDTYTFELIKNGTRPVAYLRCLGANISLQPERKKPKSDTERVSAQREEAYVPASTSANPNRQFLSAIKPYATRNCYLYLPSAFAKPNGLANRYCEMILRDDKQRSWSVQLQPMGQHVAAITRGWQQFREANSVQVGDTYKFELIDNGTTPIAYFHCKKDGMREAIDKDKSAVGDVQGKQT